MAPISAHMFALTLAFYGLRSHGILLQLFVFLLSVAVFSFAGYHLLEKPHDQSRGPSRRPASNVANGAELSADGLPAPG